MSEHFIVYSQQEYFDDLIKNIEMTKKNDRIAVTTMGFEVTDRNTSSLLTAIGAAAERGAQAYLIVDAFSQIFDAKYRPTGMIPAQLKSRKSTAHFEAKTQMLDALSSKGVNVTETNTPSGIHIPYAGRSHIKGAVVNDEWRIGGCNLADTNNLDTMIGGNQLATADFLYATFQKIAKAGNVRKALGDEDIVWRINESSELLIDTGVARQSIIYERALQAIDSAEEWLTLTCQFFPSGKTARKLAETIARGVDSYVFFNNADQSRLGGSIMNALRTASQLSVPKELFRGELEEGMEFLHAKILATEKEAILGSHNLIQAGVRLGTAEIALHTTDPQTVKRIALMAHKLTSKSDDPEFLYIHK